MVESLQTSAQLTQVVEVDVTNIARLRESVKADFLAREGVKLSYLPFFAKAAIDALKEHPKLNATIDTEAGEITYYDRENLAFAVDTEKGLLTPVVKDAGDLSIAGLAKKIADVAERTRTNKIGPDELSGGTFTITNLGSVGALLDTPIINKPQVAILGPGTVVKRPGRHRRPEPRRDDRGALHGLPGADLRPPAGRRRRRGPLPPGRQAAARGRRVRGLSGYHRLRAQVLLAGASGFLGTHLREALAARGHGVTALVRRPARRADESTWDPYAGDARPRRRRGRRRRGQPRRLPHARATRTRRSGRASSARAG